MMPLVAKLSYPRNNSTDSQVSILYISLTLYLDVYISMVSSAHAVCSKGLFIAMISTTVETDNAELEIRTPRRCLGNVC